jgi:hypothetical protein
MQESSVGTAAVLDVDRRITLVKSLAPYRERSGKVPVTE